jgi:hypothetical protein
VSFFKAYIHINATPKHDRVLKPAPSPDHVGFQIFMTSYDLKNEAYYSRFDSEALENLGSACEDYLSKILPQIVSVKIEFDMNIEDLIIHQQSPEELKSIYNKLFPPVILSAEDFSVECFGNELALKTAIKLKLGHRLENIHQDYCGTGLRYFKDQFDYIEINNQNDRILMSFTTEKSFIAWLAEQSDRSLARLEETNPFLQGNQVINKWRLLQFISIEN